MKFKELRIDSSNCYCLTLVLHIPLPLNGLFRFTKLVHHLRIKYPTYHAPRRTTELFVARLWMSVGARISLKGRERAGFCMQSACDRMVRPSVHARKRSVLIALIARPANAPELSPLEVASAETGSHQLLRWAIPSANDSTGPLMIRLFEFPVPPANLSNPLPHNSFRELL